MTLYLIIHTNYQHTKRQHYTIILIDILLFVPPSDIF